ncbi:MAG: DUF5941 domain-containing protein, partial [Acidimicrobiia bacterium]
MTSILRSYRDDLPPIDHTSGVRWLGPAALLLVGVTPGVAALVGTKDAGVWVGLTLIWFVAIGSATGTRSILTWLVAPTIRAAEYGFVIGLTYWVDQAAMSAAFGLLAALSYHEYNLVYGQRYQQTPPPPWLLVALGGWQIRMALVFVLATGDLLTPGLWVMAGWIAALAVGESIHSWKTLKP